MKTIAVIDNKYDIVHIENDSYVVYEISSLYDAQTKKEYNAKSQEEAIKKQI